MMSCLLLLSEMDIVRFKYIAIAFLLSKTRNVLVTADTDGFLFSMHQANLLLVSRDGFMLNLLTVLQLLSVKVSVDKVDSFYPHHPKAKVNISECSRFRASAQDAKDWTDKLGV